MSEEVTLFGRLAIREEGEDINAYYALPNTMEGAVLLFSVKRGAAERPGVRDHVLRLGVAIVTALLEETTGVRPTWPDPPTPAPEHEKSGRG